MIIIYILMNNNNKSYMMHNCIPSTTIEIQDSQKINYIGVLIIFTINILCIH